MNILGMIGAQFYMSFKLKHESKMFLSTPQVGEYIDKTTRRSLMYIDEIKMVSGQPKLLDTWYQVKMVSG